MTTQFITNKERLLGEVMGNMMSHTKALHFLVGFFYFSGFKEIYENVRDKKMRVLIGMETERRIANAIHEIAPVYAQKRSTTNQEKRESGYASMVHSACETGLFDAEEQQNAWRMFLEKIQDGTLEIRKTLEPNHAKLYLFEKEDDHSEQGEYPGALITGSSNLSIAGLRNRHEINVSSRDKSHFLEAMQLFNELWDVALPLADQEHYREFEEKVVQKVWINQLPSPYALYLRVLHEYFSLEKKIRVKLPEEITGNRFLNLRYQEDAIREALEMIEKHSGVIVADVVGLGKSIIASAVAHNVGLRTIILAPPHLHTQWKEYKQEFDFTAEVFGSNSIQQALASTREGQQYLIIVDEAHKYRNEQTEAYADLHKLCQGNKVVLLSATPFNNRPSDVFSLIKLFQIPAKSSIQTVESLSYRFYKLSIEDKRIRRERKEKKITSAQSAEQLKEVAAQIRDILEPVLIRRSRLDLKEIGVYWDDVQQQGIQFPIVHPPRSLEYILPAELAERYIDTLEKISPSEGSGYRGFLGARYKPALYIENAERRRELGEEFGGENLLRQGQENTSGFMRRLLVRRFESSAFAFQKTLNAMIRSSEIIHDWYTKQGVVPLFKKGTIPDPDAFLDDTLEGEEQEEARRMLDENADFIALKQKGLRTIAAADLSADFLIDLEHDIALLKEIQEEWFREGIRDDVKLEHFAEELAKQFGEDPERKIVVFTEFSDTADYLYERLQDVFPTFRYHSGHASAGNKQAIRANFDASAPEQVDDFRLLIATDAISEGYNLNRAGTVINYDIPYNPMRVVQRVGRINRINRKVFDELFIYHYFPSFIGETETRTREISEFKMHMHNAIMGEDTMYLSDGETLESFHARKFQEAESASEELSWDAKFRDTYERELRANSALLQVAQAIPKRSRIRRTQEQEQKGVVIFGKKGEEYTFKIGTSPQEIRSLSVQEALQIFRAEPDERAEPVSTAFEPVYLAVRDHLFSSRTTVPNDSGLRNTIDKIEAMLTSGSLPEHEEYLQDLLTVVRDLQALPDHHLKSIRAIKQQDLAVQVTALQADVSRAYLRRLLAKAKMVEDGEETLILAEELP